MDSPVIVCYMGGTCGDLIAAMIDGRDVDVSGQAMHPAQRQRLKKPHLFANEIEMDLYLAQISKTYRSIPSHAIEYHMNQKHDFLGIDVSDWDTAIWAATRFKKIHAPQVWQEMTKHCGAATVEAYAENLIDFGSLIRQHARHVIPLEYIRNGRAVDRLSSIISLDKSAHNLYKQWLLSNETMHNTNQR
jgi:hypothetical protein